MQHLDVRTTLTLDPDVVDRLNETMCEGGLSFKKAVNETLRLGLNAQKEKRSKTTFAVEPVAMGSLPKGLSYDCIGKLLEEADGPN